MNIKEFNKLSTAKFHFVDKPIQKFISEENSLIQYLVAKNGMFLLINTPSFAIIRQDPYIKYQYLGTDLLNLKENIIIKFPKISINIIAKIISIFNQFNHEVYCVLYFDKKDSKFVINFPEQKCYYSSVTYDKQTKYDKNPFRYLKCIDFHSHPFSSNSTFGHRVGHSGKDFYDSVENFCISCVIDPKPTIGSSTFIFEAPTPLLNSMYSVPEHKILDLEGESFIDFEVDLVLSRITNETNKDEESFELCWIE
jgi:hypothetical protein